MLFVGVLALFSLVVRPGLQLGAKWDFFWHFLDVFIIISFFISALFRFFTSPNKSNFIKENKFEIAIIFIFAMQFLIMFFFLRQPDIQETIKKIGIVSITKIYIVFAQLFIFLELLGQLGQIHTRLTSLPLPPSVLFVGSFVVVITVGTVLLLLPGATKNGISFINALFTATSATCVTGLIVVPTGSFFTRYGHTVIMTLIQIGGLGLMTFATFAALILKGELGIKERVVLGDILSFKIFSKVKSLIMTIVGFTLTIELLGAVIIYIATEEYPRSILTEGHIYFSIFHSISAFCNAGFSLWDENLLRFASNPLGSLTIMILIILGGIGFVVLANFWNFFKKPLRKKFLATPKFTLHTKFVLLMTATLIIAGALMFYATERNGQLSHLSWSQRWIASLFQSVTPRTAGFNTLDTSALTQPSKLLLSILMFIGASPGSTGGGIKTTTFGILILLIIATLSGKAKMSIFRRSIPIRIAQQAAMVLFLALCIVAIGLFFLLLFEPEKTLMQLLFEQISAFGTVGLSTGITPDLSVGGKIVLIITMLVGRIGPLTFLTAIWLKSSKTRIKYPDEELMIG
ncbi:potassium transporter Trk [bacterium]|nr:potassium transporter Trk [bacterium]